MKLNILENSKNKNWGNVILILFSFYFIYKFLFYFIIIIVQALFKLVNYTKYNSIILLRYFNIIIVYFTTYPLIVITTT